MRRLLSVVLVILFWVLCAVSGVFVLAPALDYTTDHLEYHYHGGWEGMEVRHSRSVPCEEADRWASVAERIWEDIIPKGSPSLEGHSFTFSVVKYGELGPLASGSFTTSEKLFWWRLETVSVAVPGSNGESLEEVLEVSIVRTIAHELAHLRRYLEKGDQEGCYLTSTADPNFSVEDHDANPCERATDEFATRYLEEHPELLEELLEDSG